MSRYRGIVTIDQELCKGCSLCVLYCPKELLVLSDEINQKGYHQAIDLDTEKCSGCGLCAIMCPEACVSVILESKEINEGSR